ncbi:MAG: hypothetical protein U0L49_01315 [Eubacterium sp.]|nr:hypothetical protein [Eubacterium sp.]
MPGLESFFAQITDFHPLEGLDQKSLMIVWLIILLVAALNLLIGYGLRIPDSAVGGFLMGFYAISFFGSFGKSQNIWIVAVIVGIMIGLLCLALYRLGECFLTFIVLCATFSSAGLFLYSKAGLIGLLSALVLAILTLTPFGERPGIILVTSISGAWWTVTALFNILAIYGYDFAGYLSPMIYFWIRLAAALLLAVLGIFVQAATTRSGKKDSQKGQNGRDRGSVRTSVSGRDDYTPVDYVGSDTRYNTRRYPDLDYRDGEREEYYPQDSDADGRYYPPDDDADRESYASDADRDERYDSADEYRESDYKWYDPEREESLVNVPGDMHKEPGIRTVNNRIAFEVARIYENAKNEEFEENPSASVTGDGSTRVFRPLSNGNAEDGGDTKVFGANTEKDLGQTKAFIRTIDDSMKQEDDAGAEAGDDREFPS